MKVSLKQQITLAGLTLAVAALSQQPTLSANAQQIVASPAAAQPELLAQAGVASFTSGRGKSVTGGARIIEEAGQRYLELDSSFRTDSGPDLFVLLHKEAVPGSYNETNYVSLGRLQRVARTQRYVIPADVNLADFRSAVIWCRQFDVTFGYATL